MKELLIPGIVTLMMTISLAAQAISPNIDETQAADKWISMMFDRSSARTNTYGIEVIRNRGRIQKNARYGKPLTIAGVSYKRGLLCGAPSELRIRLPKPADTFTATIGIDDAVQWDARDYQSGPLWPELMFSVSANGGEIYKSGVIGGRGTPGTTMSADLKGASEFVIKASGSKFDTWGDAIWADAKVTLADGSDLYLDELSADMPMYNIEENSIPISFIYGKQKSSVFLKDWDIERSVKRIDNNRTEHILIFTDPQTELEVKCKGISYSDYPIIEWTAYLKNNGSSDTPLIKDLRALDIELLRSEGDEFVLHYNMGSSCRIDDFKPMQTEMLPGTSKYFSPATGYSSDPYMPYFNVKLPGGEGLIVAVGWAGQWSAEFVRDNNTGLRLIAGQEKTSFKLHPGEEARTPLIALQFYRGDKDRSQNIWRRWMIKHNIPKLDGKPLSPMRPGGNADIMGFTNITEENQKEFIDRYKEEKLKIDWWWIDYGWHEGTWQPDSKRFPNGLKPVTDYAKKNDLKTITWFAPEHAPNGGKAEWLLQAPGKEPLSIGSTLSVIDLGNKEAWKWLIDMIDARITTEGISCYRHDTAFGPLDAWRAHDSKDRQGLTENHYVSGFLAFYDELLKRHPDLLIDNCCRGGRRLDLETSRRSVCLWRSDWATESIGQQSMTYGLSAWIPYFGTGTLIPDIYILRSLITPATNTGYDMRNKALDYDLLRKFNDEWWEVAPNMLGDFYALTPYTVEKGAWMAWQFNRPETGEGMIQVFRRDGKSADFMYTDKIYLKLRDLDPAANYLVRNFDVAGEVKMTGLELMEAGIIAECVKPPAALIYTYRKTD